MVLKKEKDELCLVTLVGINDPFSFVHLFLVYNFLVNKVYQNAEDYEVWRKCPSVDFPCLIEI